MSIISSTSWVPRGFASEFPVQYDFDDDEMERIAGLARLQLDEAKEDLEEEQEEEGETKSAVGALKADKKDEDGDLQLADDDDLKEYDLEHYDDDDEDAGETMGMFSNLKTLTYHENDEKDPYISLPTAEEEEEERQEWQVYPTDNLILATRTEDELSTLEVYVYDEDAEAGEENEDEDNGARSNLYVHHDIMLPSFPLCVERIDYRVGKGRIEGQPEAAGNFAAVATFEPEIEIWNLDVVDSAYPDMILGQKPDDEAAVVTDSEKKLKKKKKKKAIQKKVNDQYHIDAVLSLSHNRIHRNLLVSGSADTTVKLWDLNTGACARNFGFHEDKVSAVAWNPVEGTVLLSGGYDRNVIVSDLRVAESTSDGRRKWSVEGDVEGIKWSKGGEEFYVSTENGIIHKFDARMEGKSLWKLQAHDSEVSCFDISTLVDGYMVSGSSDKTIKLWNLNASSGPSMILSRDLDVGKVFSVGFAPDKEIFGHVVVAGSNGKVKVWDTMTNRTVRDAIGRNNNLRALFADKKQKDSDKVVGVNAGGDSDESSEGEDEDNMHDDDSGDEV